MKILMKSLMKSTKTTFLLLAALFASMYAISACSFSLPKLFSSLFKNAPKTVTNAKPIPEFTTVSYKDSAAVRFLVVGDWGTGSGFQKRVADQMCLKAASERAEFVISTGDNIYNRGVDSLNDPQWKTKFEDIYACDALQIPWYAVLGNHDHRGNIQAQIDYHAKSPRWNMPARYYTFRKTASNGVFIDFFAIDTDPLITANWDFCTEQERWLKAALQKSDARWKIVVGHHMVRSYGGYGDQQILIDRIKPLLDEFKVDLYMNGHDHDIQYIKNPTDAFYCLVSGGGGEGRDTGYGDHTIFAMTNGGFNYIAVSESHLYCEFINIEGKTLFATRISKLQTKG